MTTSHNPDSQAIIALYVCLGFTQLGQRLWRVDVRTVSRLPIDQTMQQVQHMRLGRDALIQSQLHSPDDNLFVVMKHQSEDVGRLPITTRALGLDMSTIQSSVSVAPQVPEDDRSR